MLTAEGEIADRFQLKTLIVFMKIRKQPARGVPLTWKVRRVTLSADAKHRLSLRALVTAWEPDAFRAGSGGQRSGAALLLGGAFLRER